MARLALEVKTHTGTASARLPRSSSATARSSPTDACGQPMAMSDTPPAGANTSYRCCKSAAAKRSRS